MPSLSSTRPRTAATNGKPADHQPEQNVDGQRIITSVLRAARSALTAMRASRPAMIGSGTASTMRQMTKSVAEEGLAARTTSARV